MCICSDPPFKLIQTHHVVVQVLGHLGGDKSRRLGGRGRLDGSHSADLLNVVAGDGAAGNITCMTMLVGQGGLPLAGSTAWTTSNFQLP